MFFSFMNTESDERIETATVKELNSLRPRARASE